jgi:nucleoside-diphosphate-sugar epimerase
MNTQQKQADSPELVTVFGYGPTGEATIAHLHARGTPVRLVQRRRPASLPPGVEFMSCDVLDVVQVRSAMAGAAQAVVTIGFEYRGKVWRDAWPKAMRNLLAAAEAANIRIVQVDNLYMYGPQDEPLHEDMPLTTYGVKPAVRAEVTRMWQAAARAGRVRWAALRAPDFYGPGVHNSHMGDTGLVPVAKGKAAQLLMSPDLPHAFAYVPDIGRAAVSLLDAPDDAFNQVWHVPCAPVVTPRQMLQIGADAAGVKLKVMALPSFMLQLLGVFSPAMRELSEMRFTWDRPYRVDTTKFARRFWSDATPFETGIPATIRSYPAAEPKLTRESRGQTPATTAAR